MRLSFNDTTTKKGIVQVIKRLCNVNASTESSYPLLDMTVDVNNALGNFFLIAASSQGRFQIDDTNHTDYPIIFADIVSGQQDYSFTLDEDGNQIMDVWKVRAKDSTGNLVTLKQRDLQDGQDEKINSTVTGNPTEYDLTANGIFLTDIPNYDSTDGLEVFITRTPSYFESTDTTKAPGIPHIFHEYMALRPSYFYCLSHGLKQAQGIGERMLSMEKMIGEYYSERNKDEPRRMTPAYQNNR